MFLWVCVFSTKNQYHVKNPTNILLSNTYIYIYIMQCLYMCIMYIHIPYGMNKFVGFTDRLTTCQFLCLTAAV